MKNLESLINCKKSNAVVSVAVAEDSHVLEAVSMADNLQIAKFILVGDENKIKKISDECNINIQNFEIIHESDKILATQIAVEQVEKKNATAIMKGLIDTSIIMKAVLNKDNNLRIGKKLSHLAVFELKYYHKLLFVTDAALNILPDIELKKDIIQNAIDSVINLGISNPKVALICANEKVNEAMPITLEYQQLVKIFKENETRAIVDGPFALDNAVSEESAKIKGIHSPVAGDADIIVCPNIESANILYKSLSFLANASVGGVIVGAKVPIILTSRADSSESKLNSIALGIMCSHK